MCLIGGWLLVDSDPADSLLVLAPLDGVEVNTLLHQLPERAQLAEERHPLLHCLQDVVDLEVCGEPANAKPDAGVRALITVAQSPQDVTGLQRGGCACAAGGKCDVLKSHEEGLALDVGEGDVNTARVEMVRVAVLAGMFKGEKTLQQPVGEMLDALRVILF